MQVVVGGVHGQGEARRCGKGLPCHRRTYLVDVGSAGFLHRLCPHMDADIGGFHRVVGYGSGVVRQVVRLGVGFPFADELLVGWVIHRLEVVPGRQVAHQRFGVDAAQFFLTHREGDHRHVGRLDALIGQLFVERHVGVAVDGGDHRSFAAGGEFLDVGDDGLIIAVAERRIDLFDVLVLDPFSVQEGAQDLVGGARIHIIGTQQEEALGRTAVFAQQVFHRRDRLLVRGGAGVEHVWRHLFPFVLHRVEQQPVQFFKHRQYRFARHRRPATEHRRHFVLGQQLARLFGEQRPVGSGVHHHRLEFFAQHAALGVDVIDGHQRHVFQRRFRDGHGARQRAQNADFNGIGRLRAPGHTHADHGGGQRKSFYKVTTLHN
ncbi:hypothetical protein D3C79_385990 [compost metagenome]